MSKSMLEKVAIGFGGVVLLGALWFWSLQIMSVVELLQMAYG
jgi:hypothetical protein